jgi:hypothetical protein
MRMVLYVVVDVLTIAFMIFENVVVTFNYGYHKLIKNMFKSQLVSYNMVG